MSVGTDTEEISLASLLLYFKHEAINKFACDNGSVMYKHHRAVTHSINQLLPIPF